jgi:hypothetical protein
MFELMNQRALEIGEERRREVALETMRAAQRPGGQLRHATGTAVMAVGRRIYGDGPTSTDSGERSERRREAGARETLIWRSS